MKKVFVLFTVVMLMAVMAWEKQSGKPVESEFLLDNVEALAAGESGYDTCLGQWECDLQYRRQSGICAYTFWPGLINEIPLSITMCFCSFFLLQGIRKR